MNHDHPSITNSELDEAQRLPRELREIDLALARLGAEVNVPDGLGQRVFEASRPWLGQAAAPRRSSRPAAAGVHRVRTPGVTSAGRWLLAAGMALSFVVGARLMQPSTPAQNGDVARIFEFLQPISDDPSDFDDQVAEATTIFEYDNLTYEQIESELSALELAMDFLP